MTSIAMPLATTAVDLLHQPQLRWASRRMPATSESYWKCPACEAINTSASGHCSGCEARIDLNALEWVQHGRATTAAGRDGEGQGRPILVFVATALILAPFILSVWGAFGTGATPESLVTLVWQGVLVGGFAAGVYQGIAWVRTLYFFFVIAPLLLGLAVSDVSTIAFQLTSPAFYLQIAACVVVFLAPSSASFRRL